VEVVLEGGGVVDLESLLEPDEAVWTSGIGGDIVNCGGGGGGGGCDIRRPLVQNKGTRRRARTV
jgi:hypothetical protein